jgi:hypothetical protein
MSKTAFAKTGLICVAAAMLLGPLPAVAGETQTGAAPPAAEHPSWKPWRMRIELREGRFIRSSQRFVTRTECEAALKREIVNFVTRRRNARGGHCIADGIET